MSGRPVDFARTPIAPLFITSNCYSYTPALDLNVINTATNTATLAWTSNLAVYIPLALPFHYTVRRLVWPNGSTVTGNVDIGIYTTGGGRIVSAGTTAQSGASALQYVSVTAVTLCPGRYYMALACSGSTNALWGTTTWTAPNLRAAGVLQQALGSALLPATWTPAVMGSALYPWFGFTRSSSGF